MEFSAEKYEKTISELFVRFPSFQKAGAAAYKPGLDRMVEMDRRLGCPHRAYKTVHVAGTNGKGSVSSMLASCLASAGLRVGLYTSPHILDFRERMKLVTDSSCELVPREFVYSFILEWQASFDELDLSFFEITTALAFKWFEAVGVDVAVIETGLGGRLDSTNIISPVLSIVTNIGLDHCDLLGNTLAQIASEKTGIIKPGIPAVVGESRPETDTVFEGRTERLAFADKTQPHLWEKSEEILAKMDLQGSYQLKNLRTALAAAEQLCSLGFALEDGRMADALEKAAARTSFHGRWEQVLSDPLTICDIGHNAHGLEYNFSQLQKMLDDHSVRNLTLVYGSVADKDVDAALELLPRGADLIFTNAASRRAMPAEEVLMRFERLRPGGKADLVPDVAEALRMALERKPDMIYIGGSTYVVAEAMAFLNRNK